MVDRVGRSRRSRARKKRQAVALNARAVRRARRGARSSRASRRSAQTNLEGFLFPATYDFLATTTARAARGRPARDVLQELEARSTSRTRSNKNLTPYDVLIIASMVEKETLAPDERPLVAAVIYNRLHARMPLGIDATLRYGLHIPPTQSILQSQLDSDNPYNSRKRRRPAADADREPRPRLDPGGGAPGEGRLPLLRAQAGQGAPLLHRERHRVRAVRVRARLRLLRATHVAPARASGRALALAAHAERGVRGARARLALRAPSTSTTSSQRSRRCVRSGFAGANVTIPHKQAVVAACDEADGDAVNTLVFRDGRVLGYNTDREILAGIDARARA